MTILVPLEISGGERDSLTTSVEGAGEWVSTRGCGRGESGNVLYHGRCMGVDICKIH